MKSTFFDWQRNNQKSLPVSLSLCDFGGVFSVTCCWFMLRFQAVTAEAETTLNVQLLILWFCSSLSHWRSTGYIMFLKSDKKLFDRNLQFLINIMFVSRASGSGVHARVFVTFEPCIIESFYLLLKWILAKTESPEAFISQWSREMLFSRKDQHNNSLWFRYTHTCCVIHIEGSEMLVQSGLVLECRCDYTWTHGSSQGRRKSFEETFSTSLRSEMSFHIQTVLQFLKHLHLHHLLTNHLI